MALTALSGAPKGGHQRADNGIGLHKNTDVLVAQTILIINESQRAQSSNAGPNQPRRNSAQGRHLLLKRRPTRATVETSIPVVAPRLILENTRTPHFQSSKRRGKAEASGTSETLSLPRGFALGVRSRLVGQGTFLINQPYNKPRGVLFDHPEQDQSNNLQIDQKVTAYLWSRRFYGTPNELPGFTGLSSLRQLCAPVCAPQIQVPDHPLYWLRGND